MLKALELQKLSNKISLKEPGRVRSKKLFLETIMDKILETNSSFFCETAHGKFHFHFSEDFC